jgi:DNA repair exonuclease SbcCD ATPase subunit
MNAIESKPEPWIEAAEELIARFAPVGVSVFDNFTKAQRTQVFADLIRATCEKYAQQTKELTMHDGMTAHDESNERWQDRCDALAKKLADARAEVDRLKAEKHSCLYVFTESDGTSHCRLAEEDGRKLADAKLGMETACRMLKETAAERDEARAEIAGYKEMVSSNLATVERLTKELADTRAEVDQLKAEVDKLDKELFVALGTGASAGTIERLAKDRDDWMGDAQLSKDQLATCHAALLAAKPIVVSLEVATHGKSSNVEAILTQIDQALESAGPPPKT